MRSGFTGGRPPRRVWALLVLVAVAVTAYMAARPGWIRSNVFELLPETDYDPLTATATARVDRELGTRLVFLVGHADRAAAAAAADRLAAGLRGHAPIESVASRTVAPEFAGIAAFYFPYRRQILSDAQLQAIAREPGRIERAALATLYSPFGAAYADLESDPFLLYPDSLQALRPSAGKLEAADGYLWAHGDGREYAFLTATVSTPALSIADQAALASHVNAAIDAIANATPDIDVLKTGFALYAHEATQQAQGEISTIGVGSLVGLLLLVITTFRSLRPLSLIVISILSGCTIALAVTLVAFGHVHLFTLVFGASLIGVSVDYSFHYVADDAFGAADWTPQRGFANIFAGVTLGLATSVLAYLALTVAPFPGLQQLAVFSSAGLVGAWLTLFAVCDLWHRRLTLDRRSFVLRFTRWYLSAWRRCRAPVRFGLITLLAAAVVAGYPRLSIDDDVAALQAQPEELKNQEAAIRDMLGIANAGTFLLVRAGSDEALLQAEEALRAPLDRLVATGELAGYEALSRYVPSEARQRRSYEAYTRFVRDRLSGWFESLGVADAVSERVSAAQTAAMQPFTLADWRADAVSASLPDLRVEANGNSGSIVLLYGVQDRAVLTAAIDGLANVALVDKAAELSDLFGRYRARVAQLLVAAYAAIYLGLSLRFGLRRSLLLVVPPVLAGLVALVVISAAGLSLNLFNFLALILVLGIGIDFTLFLAESHGEGVSTMFAITLSALTTMLSFGLLSLSGTHAVHSFGLTVLIGIAGAYLLAPLAVPARRRPT